MKKKLLAIILASAISVSFMGVGVEAKAANNDLSVKASVQQVQDLKITGYTADKYGDPSKEYPGAARVGDKLHISFKAEGGVGKITYSYSIVPRYGQYIPSIHKDNLDNGDFDWTPTASQCYQIDLVAKDEAGNTAREYLHYVISDAKELSVNLAGDYITKPNESIQGYAVVGQDIKLSATADNMEQFESSYTYTIQAVSHGTTATIESTDGKYTWVPVGEDLYYVTVTAKDRYGNTGSKKLTYVISHPLRVDSFTANGDKTKSDFFNLDPVELQTDVSGGASYYTYTYDIIPDFGVDAERITYTTKSYKGKYTFTPKAKGHYLVKVTVTDQQGTSISSSKELFFR